MGTDRYITWGETPEWGDPTPERLAAVARDFLGDRWQTRIHPHTECLIVECDDHCTFHLASERPEFGDPYAHPGGHATRGFEVYFDKDGRTRITTRGHSCDSFTSALARRYTEIIARWWNGEVEWPS
jgi:hypothetical protein